MGGLFTGRRSRRLAGTRGFPAAYTPGGAVKGIRVANIIAVPVQFICPGHTLRTVRRVASGTGQAGSQSHGKAQDEFIAILLRIGYLLIIVFRTLCLSIDHA
jgi:hypothetical protein